MTVGLFNAILEELLTVEEVCTLLKIKRSYLYDLTHRNQIPHLKLGRHLRFRRRDLETWLEDKRVEGAPVAESRKVVGGIELE